MAALQLVGAGARRKRCAVRERVGLMDLSTFSKYDVQGPDAHAFLERICANSIAQRDGGIVLGHLLTPAGFIESRNHGHAARR